MMLLLVLGSIWVASCMVALGILVHDRLVHPPRNGHYPDLEAPFRDR